METPVNPFSPGDSVFTKFMGAEVEVPVVQIYNNEVQIRTADKVLRWRTSKTVWFPLDKVVAEASQPSPTDVQPVPEPSQRDAKSADVSPSAEILPTGHGAASEEETAIVPLPTVGQSFVTTCGQEEAEELQRAKGKRKRRSTRRKG